VARGDRFASTIIEKAVLVGVFLPDRHYGNPPLAELEGLAEAAGTKVVGKLTQRRDAPDAATYLGSGKVKELKELVQATGADVVIFDNDLSPAQTRNLENALQVKVLDRTELILDIFATRARTHEARIAVELAQLEYSMPRLKRMWTHLSRLRKGVGLRGPGEKQLEEDRRLVEKRINDLRAELATIERRKQREVASRHPWITVSLVGYTNTGKSTLLNRLTGANVFVHDGLFATLDTRTRKWPIPGWGTVLLSDTVGFIRDLPYHLVASFRATLEEAREAHLLLHIADAASPDALDQIRAAYKVLEEIGIQQKNSILVLNKVDLLTDSSRLEHLQELFPGAIPISARTGVGLDRLESAVREALRRLRVELHVELGIHNGRLLAFLTAQGEVISRQFRNKVMEVHCRISPEHIGTIQRWGGQILRREEPPQDVWENTAAVADEPTWQS